LNGAAFVKTFKDEFAKLASIAHRKFTRKPKVTFHPETIYDLAEAEKLKPENDEDWLVVIVGVKERNKEVS